MSSILSKLIEIKPALKIVRAKLFRKGIQAEQRDKAAVDAKKLAACTLEVRAVQ